MTGKWSTVTPAEIAGDYKANLVIGPFGSNLKTSDFTVDGVPLIFVRDIRAADFSRPRAYVTSAKANELRAHIALPGDVLVTKMGDPPGDTCLYTGSEPAIITADCIRLRPSPQFDAGFIAHALRAPNVRRQILSITTGAAQQKVSLDRFRNGVKFEVPPLEEQRRIAGILDQADAIRAKRRQVLAHVHALTRSIFHDMFGNTGANRATIGSFAEVRTGSTPSRKDPSNYGGSIPWVKTGEVQGTISSTAEYVTAQGMANARLRLFPVGSVVIAMYGQGATRGKSAILGIEATTNQACAVIEPNEMFDPVFLQAQLEVSYDRLRCGAEGGNQPNLSVGRISKFDVLLPELRDQICFRERVEVVNTQRAVVRRALHADSELFASLQARAFKGEL